MTSKSRYPRLRVGHGYDIHRLDALFPKGSGKPIVLGGFAIECEIGVVGNSDADILLHAATEALMGAIGAGATRDIRPLSQPDKTSSAMARNAAKLCFEEGWRICNLDATIVLEFPKIGDRCNAIARSLEHLLSVEHGTANVKAKSAEGIGEVGMGQAIEAFVVVLLIQHGTHSS